MEYVSVQGVDVPKIGFGTYRLDGRECYDSVTSALELGYRHIDTAAAYGNEREVGRALADSDVDREDVFLTTKVTGYNARRDAVAKSARRSVEHLGVDAVDLLLIHWPFPLVSVEQTMAGLTDCVEEGLARHIGVSNYGLGRLQTARRHAEVPILTDQVQFNPYWQQDELVSYAARYDVMVTSYSPLARGGIVDDDLLTSIASKYEKTPAQVALRWVIQHENVVTIPMSTNPSHQADNLAVFDFSLTDREMDRIARPSRLRAGLAWLRGYRE